MPNKYVISQPYEVDPNTLKYDSKMSGFNSAKPDLEYQTLKGMMEATGQTSPAFLRNGLLGDGVHRAKICIELGIRLLVVDIDPGISDKKYILMCNENTTGARNYSPAQQAIKGYLLTKDFGYTDAEVAKNLGIKDRRVIGYVRKIAASPLNKEYRIIETLGKGESVNIEGKYTSSIDTAKRRVMAIEEARAANTIDIASSEVVLRYDDFLNTERAKEEFWEDFGTVEMPTETKLRVVGLLNIKYKPLELITGGGSQEDEHE